MTDYLIIETNYFTKTLILYKNTESVQFNDFEKTIIITALSGKEYIFRFLSSEKNNLYDTYDSLKERILTKIQTEA